MIVCCFTASGGLGALTRDTVGGNLPAAFRPWIFCRIIELRDSKDDRAAMHLIGRQGYCLFRYPEPASPSGMPAHNLE